MNRARVDAGAEAGHAANPGRPGIGPVVGEGPATAEAAVSSGPEERAANRVCCLLGPDGLEPLHSVTIQPALKGFIWPKSDGRAGREVRPGPLDPTSCRVGGKARCGDEPLEVDGPNPLFGGSSRPRRDPRRPCDPVILWIEDCAVPLAGKSNR